MKHLRKNLALAYQIVAKWGWDDSTYTHISARLDSHHFLIMPFGLLFEEVTPESLLVVDLEGNVIEGREYQYNKTGYVTHGSIYQGRSDLNAIFHLHTEATIAVSATKEGLLPLSQWALHFYDRVSYSDYDSLALNTSTQGSALVRDLGDNSVMLLRNHGVITAGKTIHEALFYLHHLEHACRVQAFSKEPSSGWLLPDHQLCNRARMDLLSFEEDLGRRDWNAYVRQLIRENKRLDIMVSD